MQSCPKCGTLNRSSAKFCKQCGTSLRLAPGTLIGNRYSMVRHLAQGGMGSIYEAEDQRLGHTVVLKKEILVNGNARHQLLKNEKRLLVQLRHLALPRVIDYFTEGDGQYLVMEYVPGHDLDHLIKVRNAPFPMSQVLDWTGQLLNVLDYLHSRRPPIIHNDIKPANLRLTPENYLVLLDFGLSTLKGEAVLGFTRHYAPLEQIGGRGTDERSDLYALGATLYHLLTGSLPPAARDRANAMNRGESDPLRVVSDLNPEVWPIFTSVLMQTLTLDHAQRLISTREMRAMLGIEPPPLSTTSIQAIPNQPATGARYPTESTRYPTEPTASEAMPSSSLPPAAQMPSPPYPKASEPITSYPLQEVEAFALAEIEGVDEDIPLRANEAYKLLAAILRDKPSGLSVQALRLPDFEVIEIDITVRASGFDIAPNWHQRVKFIRGRDSGLVEFILVPKETGDKKIEVEFYYERHWLTAIVLDVTVIAHDLGGE